MRREEAASLVATLAAAYPWLSVRDDTVALFVEALAPLRYEPARDAVASIVQTSSRFPTVSEIRDEYRRYLDRYALPALPEPELTEEERAENLRRIRELASRIGRGIVEG